MPDAPSLGKLTFFATLWTVGSRVFIRFLGVISLVILAKILGPEDYGLVGKAMVIYGFLELITALGLESALIANQKATQSHYNTAWTLHILRGTLIAAILAAVAIPAAELMNEERLVPIIYCYAGISFIRGFYNIGVVDFRKNMTFSKDFYYSLYQKICGFIVTITVAFIWETYWALVIGVVASMIAQIISSFWMSPMRPRFDLSEFNTLFNFSKWMVLNEIIDAIAVKIDGFLLSVYSTTANVGLYNMSYEISGTPSTEIAMPVARACAPSFSKLTDNIKEFSKMYVDTLSIVMAVVVPAATGVSLLAEPIVLVALDDTWVDAIPVIQVLAFYGLCRASFPTFISASLASNRPDILTKTATVKAFYTVAILFVGVTQFGFMGLVWGVLIAGIISMIIAQSIMWKMNILSISKLMINLWRVALANAVMVVGVQAFLTVDMSFLEGLMLIELLIETLVGVIIYGVTLVLLWIVSGKVDGPEKAILSVLLRGRWGTA